MSVLVEAISHFWATIEPFVDVISLVSVSKSCRLLHGLVVDATTGKIKSSYVKVNNVFEGLDEEGHVVWGSPSARIPHYVPKLMNTIHFPSITCLDIFFPPNVTVWNGQSVIDPRAFPAAFPMFAIQASNVNKLEELAITVNSLIVHEEGGGLQPVYKILGGNLAKCVKVTGKLKRLVISNEATFEDGYSKYSSAFMAALVPVLQAGICSLEEIRIDIGDAPSCSDFPTAGYDFFNAVLRLQNLRKLVIKMKSAFGELLNDFIEASTSIRGDLGRLPSESLEYVDVSACFLQVDEEESHRLSILPFLSLCHRAPALRSFTLWLPPECYDSQGIQLLSELMNGSCPLNYLSVNFHGYNSRTLMTCLLRFVEERAPSPDMYIHMLRMGNLAEQNQSFQNLGGYVQAQDEGGEIVWDFLHTRPATGDKGI